MNGPKRFRRGSGTGDALLGDVALPGRQVALRSVMYTISGSLGAAFLTLGRSIIVARILAPAEFGRFVLVATVLGVMDVASQPGLEVAALQQPKLRGRTLETLWTVLIIRAVILTAALMALAGPISRIFGAEESVNLLRAIAFVPLLRSFSSLAVLAQAHRVNLAPESRLRLAGQAADTIVAILASSLTGSAAGLVLGVLSGAAVEMAGSWLVSGFRPRFRMEPSDLFPLLRFGRWVFLSNILAYISTNGDDLAIGRFAGHRALGLYRVAYRIGNLPTTQLSQAIAKVAFPFLARSQEAMPEERQHLFLRYLTLTSATSGLLAVILSTTADPLVLLVLGSTWAEASTPMAILATAGATRSIVAAGGILFMAGGTPYLDTMMQAMRTVVLALGVVLLLGPFGISGVAVASLFSVLAVVPLWLIGLCRTGLTLRLVLTAVLGPIPALAGSAAAAFGVAALIEKPLPSVAITAMVAFSSWLALTLAFHPSLRRELTSLVHRSL